MEYSEWKWGHSTGFLRLINMIESYISILVKKIGIFGTNSGKILLVLIRLFKDKSKVWSIKKIILISYQGIPEIHKHVIIDN